MIPLIMSLIAMIAFGTEWLFITFASREIGALRTTFLVQAVGISFLLPLYPAANPSISLAYLLALLTISIGETGLLLLMTYAFQIGELVVISPVLQLYAIVSVFLGIVFLHEAFSALKLVSIVLVVVGVVLLSANISKIKQTSRMRMRKGVPSALIAAVGTGLYLFLVGLASRGSGWFYTALLIRIGITITMAAILLTRGVTLRTTVSNVPWKPVIAAAIFDVVGFATFSAAVQHYAVSYVTVITSADPLVTVLLGMMVLRERLRGLQIVGIALTMLGVVSLQIS